MTRSSRALLLAFALCACSRAQPEHEPVRVAVAANFADTAEAIAALFESETGIAVEFSIGSTGALCSQIENGAPFDVFLAADRERPLRLVEAGRARASRTYAVGRLALVGPALDGYVAGVDDRESLIAVLRGDDVAILAIANPDTAPYGRAAADVLAALGLTDSFERRLALGLDVAQAHQFAATGAADLAFVALAQALARPSEAHIAVPPELHAPVLQDAVLIAADEDAARFFAFLGSDAARAVLERAGYGAEAAH